MVIGQMTDDRGTVFQRLDLTSYRGPVVTKYPDQELRPTADAGQEPEIGREASS